MKYIFREMTIDDINEVIEGETKIFGESLGYDMLYTELKFNPFSHYFVLEIDKKICGYIGTWIEEEHAELINFYVLEEYQNMGFGSMMLEFVIKVVKMSKVPVLSLEVREHNTHTRKNYYSNGEDALVLILEA